MRTDSPLLKFYYSKLPKAQEGQQTGDPDKPYSKSNPQGYVSMKNNKDWFDNHANWTNTGDTKIKGQDWDDYVRQQIMTGRFGLDPKSGALIKLPQSEWTKVSEEDKRLATDKRQWTAAQKQTGWENQVKPQIVQSTKELITNPVMMAPGAILTGGMAAGIPAISRTAAAIAPALETSIGGVPGLTTGNLINAGFAYEGAKNVPNVVNSWQDVINDPTWGNVGNATGETAVTAFDMLPFAASAYKGIPNLMQKVSKPTSLVSSTENVASSIQDAAKFSDSYNIEKTYLDNVKDSDIKDYKKYLKEWGQNTEGVTDDQLKRMIAANEQHLQENATGVLKGQTATHVGGIFDQWDPNRLASKTGDNGFFGAGMYFTPNERFGTGFTGNSQPYVISGIENPIRFNASPYLPTGYAADQSSAQNILSNLSEKTKPYHPVLGDHPEWNALYDNAESPFDAVIQRSGYLPENYHTDKELVLQPGVDKPNFWQKSIYGKPEVYTSQGVKRQFTGPGRNLINLGLIPPVVLGAAALNQDKKAYGGLTQYGNGGGLLSRTVTCSNCGWSWKGVDGGMDPTTCHKCGGQIKMQQGGDISIPALTTKMPALSLGGSIQMQPKESPLLNYYLQRTGGKRMIR